MNPAPEVPGFEIEERIGAGGMGVVFRARQVATGRVVALKVLAPRDASEIERARREASVLERLAHPAIVQHVADGVTADGSPFIAMEWIGGITAAQRIASQGFTLAETVALARRITSALAAAHDLGILHRDIKPSNVLLPDDDPARAMLIDFGIARVDAVATLTRTGTTVGTPGYMAPEQARGQRVLAPSIDIFGLGCTLYECATGMPAFSGTSPAAILIKILVATPLAIDVVCPEAPAPFVAWIERMLHKDANQRTPDPAAVLAELAELAPMVDGPRRNAHRLSTAATALGATSQRAHCIVLASRGTPDDVMEPPTDEQRAALVELASRFEVGLEICATNGVLVHVVGEPRRASRIAAEVALELQRILPLWSIAIAANDDSAIAAESAATALGEVAMSDLFRRTSSIVVDRVVATLLTEAYEISDGKLAGRKR